MFGNRLCASGVQLWKDSRKTAAIKAEKCVTPVKLKDAAIKNGWVSGVNATF